MYPEYRRLEVDRCEVALVHILRRKRIIDPLYARRNVGPIGRRSHIPRVIARCDFCGEYRGKINLLAIGKRPERWLEIKHVHNSTWRVLITLPISTLYSLHKIWIGSTTTTSSVIGPGWCSFSALCATKAKRRTRSLQGQRT